MSDKKQLKEAIKREYAKCATDPTYFLGKYGIIQHPVRGKVNFNLYDFQEKSLESVSYTHLTLPTMLWV